MRIEMRPVDLATEAEAISEMDKKIFLPSDAFDDPARWEGYECFWIVVDGQVAGSVALAPNRDFGGSWEKDTLCPGCLFIVTTGILPEFQRRGVGSFVKAWQIDFAKRNGFARISTNFRKSNLGSLRLNTNFGFKVVDEVPGYFSDPDEPTIVMELELS
jgi:GNAT superfamily N-acetyltransferase